jgi:predicted DNA-binding protein YlxM (UPF0122 family)
MERESLMMKWTKEDFDKLNELYASGNSVQFMANHFQVSISAVKSALYRRKHSKPLRMRTKYVKWDESLEKSIENALKKSSSLSEVSEKLGITYASLTSKMRRMNLSFHQYSTVDSYTPKKILEILSITESQLRQVLNNRTINCEVRGKQLFITKESLYSWLDNGNSLLYFPVINDENFIARWSQSVFHVLTKFTSMDEIAEKFERSKMSISYYGKKKNFPPVCGYVNSFNMYIRNDVNQWSSNNNMPLLPEQMEWKYFQMISNGIVPLLLKRLHPNLPYQTEDNGYNMFRPIQIAP